MKPGRDAAQRWLRQAEHDLRIACGHQGRADYSDACFMAEQAAQKALKAFLMWQGQRSIPLHSVAQLVERCAQLTLTSPRIFPLDVSWINTTSPRAPPMRWHHPPCRLSRIPKNRAQEPSRLYRPF